MRESKELIRSKINRAVADALVKAVLELHKEGKIKFKSEPNLVVDENGEIKSIKPNS